MDTSTEDIKQNESYTIDPSKFCSVDGCRAYKVTDSEYCFFHSKQNTLPKKKQHNAEIVLSKDLVSIKNYLISLAIQVEKHKLKPNEANALNNLVNTVLKVHQITDLEDKIEQLTKAFEASKTNKDAYDLALVDGEYQ